MRNNINLRAYAGKDPFIEYKRESAELFQDMIFNIEEKSLIRISHAKLQESASQEEILDKLSKLSKSKKNAKHNYSSTSNISDQKNKTSKSSNIKQEKLANIGRNEKCPCGSGLKFKHCCGKIS
jgi:preprotein translocase subunit SecA